MRRVHVCLLTDFLVFCVFLKRLERVELFARLWWSCFAAATTENKTWTTIWRSKCCCNCCRCKPSWWRGRRRPKCSTLHPTLSFEEFARFENTTRQKKKIILIAEVSFLKLWMNDVPSLVRVQLLHTVEETIQTLLVTVQKDAPPPPPLLPALRDLIADAFRRGAPEVSEKKTDFSTQRFNPRKTKGCSCSSGAECSVAEQG
jgi:hypothetical protein